MKGFFTDRGVAVPSVTAAEMREVDRLAMSVTGPNLFQMMENAGRNLALHTLDFLGPRWREAKVLVLAGGGGNGGGGICAARHLANRDVDVTVLVSDPDRLGEVPSYQRKIFASTRGREADAAAVSAARFDVIVDALIGYGLTEAPRGPASDLIAWANGSGAPILALDVPSGMNATTGDRPGVCIRAASTLTLALPKAGLLAGDASELWLADIGIPRSTYEQAGVTYVDPFGDRYRVRLIARESGDRPT